MCNIIKKIYQQSNHNANLPSALIAQIPPKKLILFLLYNKIGIKPYNSDNSPPKPKMDEKYLKTVVWSSIVIMVYQGIANSNLGIVSQLTHQNGNNWAGPLSTALLFMGSGLSSLYHQYIGRYRFRYCFFVGSFGYILFISLSLVFIKLGFSISIQVLIFILSLISGCLCSVFYNTQFNYINILAKIDNKQVKYFGINMALAQCSSIFGNLLSTLLIKPLGQFLTVLIMDILAFLTAIVFLFFREPSKQQYIKFSQQQGSSQNGSNSENNQVQSVITQKLDETRKNSTNKFPLKIISAFSFSGIIISFIYCMLSIIMYRTFQDDMSDTELNHLTFILFIFEGLGQLIGGLTMIFVSSKIKNIPKALIFISTLFLISLGIIYVASLSQNKYIMGVGIVLCGFCDCSYFVLGLSLAGIWKEKGISFFNIGQSVTVASSVMLMAFLSFQLVLIWIFAFFAWNFVSLILYQKQTKKQQIQTIE